MKFPEMAIELTRIQRKRTGVFGPTNEGLVIWARSRSSPEELVSSAFFSLCQIHQIMPSQHGNSLSVTNYSGTDAMAYKFMTTSMEDMMIIYQCTPSRHSKAADHHLKWIRQIWAYQLRFFCWTYVSMSFESEPCWFHDG